MAAVPQYPGALLPDILADMIRSALTWEENHECPPDPKEHDEGLTDRSFQIPEEKPASTLEEGEGEDDHCDPKPKQAP